MILNCITLICVTCRNFYNSQFEYSIKWNDKDLGIKSPNLSSILFSR